MSSGAGPGTTREPWRVEGGVDGFDGAAQQFGGSFCALGTDTTGVTLSIKGWT